MYVECCQMIPVTSQVVLKLNHFLLICNKVAIVEQLMRKILNVQSLLHTLTHTHTNSKYNGQIVVHGLYSIVMSLNDKQEAYVWNHE